VFHNYGHGSSGISLAYGSAFLTMKQLTVHVSNEKPRECAVIGSGLIALLTALELTKNG
jgi:glycine/D-amino acid oxidase-like deaminating enzyme